MPRQCKKCGDGFPSVIRIDGKKKNLASRKYCLVCSPWGQHNTVKLHLANAELVTAQGTRTNSYLTKCTCKKCHREFAYEPKKGHTKSKCNTCQVNSRRPARKAAAVKYKGGGCLNCGYRSCERALDFHHLDPTQKDMAISKAYLLTESTLCRELDKCVLLCCRCHSEVHEGLVSRDDLERLEGERVKRDGTGEGLFSRLLRPTNSGD